ncbi:EamA family transporter [Nioella nitratireducens]|uniref:EamA family transporter n=1 Tax=Nioella nitratireducens TaxID=1287720 RepID=UPI0008FD4804|nr:EamA family transporter [Nioella nitratireducens]
MAHLTTSWQIWALLAAIFAALTAIFAKIGVEGIDSDLATFLRTIVVVAALGLLVFATGKTHGLTDITPRTALFLVLSGLATGASWLCYFRALQLGDAGRVAPVDKLSVVFVAIIAAIFLGERMSGVSWGGVALVAIGSVLVAVG